MTQIEVTWKKMGPEFTYEVWYSKDCKGPWRRGNLELLSDYYLDERTDTPSATENTYTLNDLDDKSVYFIKVSCDDRYYQWWYSYLDVDSIEGGEGSLLDEPVPDGGNVVSFQVNVE